MTYTYYKACHIEILLQFPKILKIRIFKEITFEELHLENLKSLGKQVVEHILGLENSIKKHSIVFILFCVPFCRKRLVGPYTYFFIN